MRNGQGPYGEIDIIKGFNDNIKGFNDIIKGFNDIIKRFNDITQNFMTLQCFTQGVRAPSTG
jgi:hypothetical protein